MHLTLLLKLEENESVHHDAHSYKSLHAVCCTLSSPNFRIVQKVTVSKSYKKYKTPKVLPLGVPLYLPKRGKPS
jgi:hypothetical protein